MKNINRRSLFTILVAPFLAMTVRPKIKPLYVLQARWPLLDAEEVAKNPVAAIIPPKGLNIKEASAILESQLAGTLAERKAIVLGASEGWRSTATTSNNVE
jgi:hypothetical protein